MPVNEYLRQEIMNMPKEELILKLYEIGIGACEAKDRVKACKVFAELIDSLNFEYGELPIRLFRLYEYAMNEVKNGRYEMPIRILTELRNTWKKAFNL